MYDSDQKNNDDIRHHNKIQRVAIFGYVFLAIAMSLGLYFNQRIYTDKFCNVTISTRESRLSALEDRRTQAALWKKYAISQEIEIYYTNLYKKIDDRIKTDPEIQKPITCEVYKK